MHKSIFPLIVSALLLSPAAVFAQEQQPDTASFKSTDAARVDDASAESKLDSRLPQPYGDWTLKPESAHVPSGRACDGVSVMVKCDKPQLDLQTKRDLDQTPSYKVTDAQFRENRQKMLDSFIDDHLGGVGRIKFRGDGYEGRLEYGYTTSCRSKRAGVCLSLKF